MTRFWNFNGRIELRDNENETQNLIQSDEESHYSFQSREMAPKSNLKKWENVTFFQNEVPKIDTKQISEYNNVNPIKEWRYLYCSTTIL